MTSNHRLTDNDIATSLRNGMPLLQPPEPDAAFHARCFATADRLYRDAKRQGGTTAPLQLP